MSSPPSLFAKARLVNETTLLIADYLWDQDDFTEFLKTPEKKPATGTDDSVTAPSLLNIPFDAHSLPGSIQVVHADHKSLLMSSTSLIPDDLRHEVARYQLCKCFQGKHYSITTRITNKVNIEKAKCERRAYHRGLNTGSPAPAYVAPDTNTPSIKYPLPQRALWECLYSLIFDMNETHPHGIIVVTGSTGTGKSTLVRGLIQTYLEHKIKHAKSRRPHFLTVEDPIEMFYYNDPVKAQECGLDYTPREIGKDTTGITQVFQDALRQTPAIVYVGEVRRLEDWNTILDFAGTGHLVITTAHAGSLVEAMDRILKAANADSPVRRGQVAESLMAVIHLQNTPTARAQDSKFETSKTQQEITLPALWRRTATSVAALVADGLGSVLPGRNPVDGSLGRQWFAKELMLYGACFFHQNDVGWEELDKLSAINSVSTFPVSLEFLLSNHKEKDQAKLDEQAKTKREEMIKILNQFVQRRNDHLKDLRDARKKFSGAKSGYNTAKIGFENARKSKTDKQSDKETDDAVLALKKKHLDATEEDKKKQEADFLNDLNALIWKLESLWNAQVNPPASSQQQAERLKTIYDGLCVIFNAFIELKPVCTNAAGCVELPGDLRCKALQHDLQGR